MSRPPPKGRPPPPKTAQPQRQQQPPRTAVLVINSDDDDDFQDAQSPSPPPPPAAVKVSSQPPQTTTTTAVTPKAQTPTPQPIAPVVVVQPQSPLQQQEVASPSPSPSPPPLAVGNSLQTLQKLQLEVSLIQWLNEKNRKLQDLLPPEQRVYVPPLPPVPSSPPIAPPTDDVVHFNDTYANPISMLQQQLQYAQQQGSTSPPHPQQVPYDLRLDDFEKRMEAKVSIMVDNLETYAKRCAVALDRVVQVSHVNQNHNNINGTQDVVQFLHESSPRRLGYHEATQSAPPIRSNHEYDNYELYDRYTHQHHTPPPRRYTNPVSHFRSTNPLDTEVWGPPHPHPHSYQHPPYNPQYGMYSSRYYNPHNHYSHHYPMHSFEQYDPEYDELPHPRYVLSRYRDPTYDPFDPYVPPTRSYRKPMPRPQPINHNNNTFSPPPPQYRPPANASLASPKPQPPMLRPNVQPQPPASQGTKLRPPPIRPSPLVIQSPTGVVQQQQQGRKFPPPPPPRSRPTTPHHQSHHHHQVSMFL